MNISIRVLCLIVACVSLPVLLSSCPGSEASFDVYLLNSHSTEVIDSFGIFNEDTQELDELLDDPIPPGEFARIGIPLAPYATNEGSFLFSSGRFLFSPAFQAIDGTPFAFAMCEDGQGAIVFGFARGGGSLSKLLLPDSPAEEL